MIITQNYVERQKTTANFRHERELKRIARLERTAKLHQMEQKLKRFKHIKFVKELQGVRLHCKDSQLDKELFTFDFYDEVLADMHATKTAVRQHYIAPWLKSIII